MKYGQCVSKFRPGLGAGLTFLHHLHNDPGGSPGGCLAHHALADLSRVQTVIQS